VRRSHLALALGEERLEGAKRTRMPTMSHERQAALEFASRGARVGRWHSRFVVLAV
ncbi:hypothetical protein CSUI_008363, partial [Cystoisospora suis]